MWCLIVVHHWVSVCCSSLLFLQVLVLVMSSNHKSLSLDQKTLENCQGLLIMQTVRYVWSCGPWIRLPLPCMRLQRGMAYLLMSDITAVCRPLEKSLSLRILEDQFTSPCPCPRSPWQHCEWAYMSVCLSVDFACLVKWYCAMSGCVSGS